MSLPPLPKLPCWYRRLASRAVPLRLFEALYGGESSAFLYESLWNLLTFLVLYTLAVRFRDKLLLGELLGMYLILYPTGRILLETVRLDSPTFVLNGVDTGINIASALAGLAVVLIAGLLLWRRRRVTREKPV